MIIQIINLTYQNVFKTYSEHYSIFRDVYQHGLLGLELRYIPSKLAEVVQKIILNEKQICYKIKSAKEELFSLLIPGTCGDFKELSRKILSNGDEDLGYKIIKVVKNFEEYDLGSFAIGNRRFIMRKSYVMGVLNVTPDSFSDGGQYLDTDSAVEHGLQILEDGADMLDIGGESSRPGSQPVEADVELKRVIPVIKKILSFNNSAIISVDTTKSKVADEALKAGALIINDISAGEFDPTIIDVVKNHNAAIIVMHMKGKPATMQDNPLYEDVIREIYDFLCGKVKRLVKAGISNIIIDPGIGFGKRVEDNFEIIRRIEDFKSIGYPLLAGLSRKGFIGKTLELDVHDRDTATAILEALAIKNGARIIRTHNTQNGSHVTKLLNTIS